MRQSHTFLLTVLIDDGESDLYFGRIQYVADEREAFFRSTEELLAFMRHVVTRPPPCAPRKAQSDE